MDWSARSPVAVKIASEPSLISDATSENMPIFDYTLSIPLDASSTLHPLPAPPAASNFKGLVTQTEVFFVP